MTIDSDLSSLSSLRDEHRRVTHARIAAAAENLFKMNGFRATSVNDIVQAAGTTATTFYRYFKSKGELAWVIQDELRAAVESETTKLDNVETLSDIRDWLEGYVVMWRRAHMLCSAFWEATLADEQLRRTIMPGTMALIRQLRGLLSRIPESNHDGIAIRLSTLVLALDRVAYVADTADSESSRSAILDEFATIMFRSLMEH
ncbi:MULTISPECIES: TetR/AcrR family transcriptional regulator [Paraburkholderia]|uniref:Helix-turn-helix domain-containing protein n=1 Tax=Paraburkholderia guartelaensis TaxID=2546446 RepID=A0ABU9SEH7_9BURK|nr:TetR/AcrR family transcriptional regulator [Paraburkholderia nodosa]